LAGKISPLTEVASTLDIDRESYTLIDIRATGDILLDATFENRKSSQKLGFTPEAVPRSGPLIKATTIHNSRLLYRVRLDTLTKTSKYFELLLTSDKFVEGNNISTTFDRLRKRGIQPSEAEPQDLPRISITDDDDSTRITGREAIFGDLLRVLHGADITTRFTIPYLAALAVMADRFDCTPTIGRYVKRSKRFLWPQTYGNMSVTTDELIRQKILISWLLDDPPRFTSATKELILRGSLRWTASDDRSDKEQQATWWDLQDGLEGMMGTTTSSMFEHG
jgi:hypothetical protein